MDPDAYQDDMARFLRLSDEDVDRLFRGLPPGRDEDLRDLADFLATATQALARPPRTDVEAGHLALLAVAVRPRSDEAVAPTPAGTTGAPIAGSTERRGLTRLRTVRWGLKVAVATASIVLMTAALAFAGVDLPGTAAETAFQKVLGVDLPNQAEEHAGAVPEELPESAADTAVAVLDVIREWRSGVEWNGCEFGAAVSAAARGLEGEPDTSHCAGAAGAAGGGVPDAAAGAAAGGSGNASHADDGLQTAGEASGGGASVGSSNADEGLGTADEASDGAGSGGAGSDGASNAGDGLGTAEEASDGAIGGVGGP
jgi:hypothetical protein